MNLQTVLIYIFLFVIISLGIGCNPSSTRDSIRKSDLVGTKWKLTNLTKNRELLTVEDSEEFSLEFRDELIGGRFGCNNYQAGWVLGSDGRFALSGPIAVTKVGCLSTVQDLENSYITVLENAHTIVMDQEILVLSSTDGQLVFEDNK